MAAVRERAEALAVAHGRACGKDTPKFAHASTPVSQRALLHGSAYVVECARARLRGCACVRAIYENARACALLSDAWTLKLTAAALRALAVACACGARRDVRACMQDRCPRLGGGERGRWGLSALDGMLCQTSSIVSRVGSPVAF
eukprot:6081318-Pleurochrysis_carterae.AAC.2